MDLWNGVLVAIGVAKQQTSPTQTIKKKLVTHCSLMHRTKHVLWKNKLICFSPFRWPSQFGIRFPLAVAHDGAFPK